MGVERIRLRLHESILEEKRVSFKNLHFGLKTPENVVLLENENAVRSVSGHVNSEHVFAVVKSRLKPLRAF